MLDAFGGIDLLVNNAGIPKRRHVTALNIDTITQVMHINYLSPMRLTMALLPQMLERGTGTIVNVSSIAAQLSAPGEAAYDASKAALTAFSEAMAMDLWETGIKLMVVYPGVIDTPLFSLPDNDVPDLPVTGRARLGRRGCDPRRTGERGGPGLRAGVLPRHLHLEGPGRPRLLGEHRGLPPRAPRCHLRHPSGAGTLNGTPAGREATRPSRGTRHA